MGSIDKSAIAVRQKRLEHAGRVYFPARTYTVARFDGRSFHGYAANMTRPYDTRLIEAMREAMRAICNEASGCVLGYCQSDEITIVMTDFASEGTEAWFGGSKSKIESVGASIVSGAFNAAAARLFGDELGGKIAAFDGRAWAVPDPAQVAENFIFRQQDAERNSVSMLAQAYFSHRQLQGVGRRAMIEMLEAEHGVRWADQPASFKRGSVCVRRTEMRPVEYTRKDTGERIVSEPVERSLLSLEDAPIFTRSTMLIDTIPQPPAFTHERIIQRSR
jgi:tRNA(His) guanylyltransferase